MEEEEEGRDKKRKEKRSGISLSGGKGKKLRPVLLPQPLHIT
jgi:hypothetical protein